MAQEPRRPLVVGNWAMHLNHYEANKLVQQLAHSLTEKELAAVEVAVLPPFTAIRSVQTAVDGDKWQLRYGAQDISAHPSGPYTGEVSGAMLSKLGVAYVLVGAYARRLFHHENDELVNAKVKAALASEISPVLCVGEPAAEHDEGTGLAYTLAQLDAGLHGLTAAQVEKVVVAYEPVWSGVGAPAPKPVRGAPLVVPPDVTAGEAQEAAAAIRARIGKLHSASVAAASRIVYAGRVNGVTVAPLLAEADIDGVLVGELSLDAGEFVKICRLGEAAS